VTTFTRVVRIGIATTIVSGICWFIPLVSHWAFLWRINTLVSMAQSYPKDIAPARALIQIAKGPLNSQIQKFRSTYAIHAVGQVGPAASPVVSDLADVLDSPEVSQQAARALENLGSIVSFRQGCDFGDVTAEAEGSVQLRACRARHRRIVRRFRADHRDQKAHSGARPASCR